jgi:hypothetical protein
MATKMHFFMHILHNYKCTPQLYRNVSKIYNSIFLIPQNTMLPPIEEAILHSNPKFEKLHERLSAEILNPDGSTKNHPAQKERDAVTAVGCSSSHLRIH